MSKLRVAIIGQGRSGRDIHGAHLSTDKERYKIAAVVDPLPARRARAEQEYGCESLAEHTALLKRKDLDLIVNAAPSGHHVPITLEFLEAGFNVLCEKPLASHVSDVDRLIEAAEKTGKTFAIFQQSRFAPYYRKIREVIDSGVLGEIVQVSVCSSGFDRRYDWQTLTDEMGGCLHNTGPHPLDQVLQIFGNDAKPNVTCFMRSATCYGDAEDHVLLVLSGDHRPLIHLEISASNHYSDYTYNVYGTRGGLKGTTSSLKWRYYDPAKAPVLTLLREPLRNPDGTPAYCKDHLEWVEQEWTANDALFAGMSHAFYTMLHAAIVEGAPLEITPQQVRQQIAVIEECRRQNPHIYPNG
jgi:scyllo-inositol 2-dehydrogenase (NADP+)